ncbi:hypothetical protein IH992_13355 [Candidatus Poribacteria bacterium]|nr:hypothetical protein [Candidatus Poribacteria bacterium]
MNEQNEYFAPVCMMQKISSSQLEGRPEENRLIFALTLGLILIPINAYWIALVSGLYHSLNPAYASLFIAPVVNLFLLVLLRLLLKRTFPRFAPRRPEMLLIYQMLVMLCLVAGHNPMDFLLGTLVHPFWFATPENEYTTLFHQYIPQWLTIQDKAALSGFFEGESTLYTVEHLSAWAGPVLLWSCITFVLFFILICINSIQRLQWTEGEKLSYPIAQLPIEMSAPGFLRHKLLWVGFAVAGLIEIFNGIHFLYPVVPGVPLKIPNFGATIFTTKPWSAIGWLPLFFYPWVIALTFFVPLDLSFSVWFFFLFTKAQLILGSIGGWKSLPEFPYYNHQGLGTWLTLGILVLWSSKNHLKRVFSTVLNKSDSIDDSQEPLKYRTGVLGIFIGTAFLVILFQQAGMSIGIVLAFFALYFIMAIAITHARATVGLPYHEIIWTHPQLMLVSTLGTRRIGGANLTLMSFLYPYVRDNVSHPMPSQLEGFKISQRARIEHRQMVIAMMVGLFFSLLASFWSYLHVMYQHGAIQSEGYILGFGRENFGGLLLPWLQHPRDVDGTGLSFTALAAVFTIFLMFMRRLFIWWPFHPAGYALGLSSGTVWIWSAVLIGWGIKAIVLKFGGVSMYRKAGPFFFGVILGDYVVGSVWSIIGAIFQMPVYRVWY